MFSGTGNCAAPQGAGDRGRRNAQVGGGLPWRDAGRQCSGQRFRSRRKQCMPGRLSSGLLAQQSSELAAGPPRRDRAQRELFPAAGRGSGRTEKFPGLAQSGAERLQPPTHLPANPRATVLDAEMVGLSEAGQPSSPLGGGVRAPCLIQPGRDNRHAILLPADAGRRSWA